MEIKPMSPEEAIEKFNSEYWGKRVYSSDGLLQKTETENARRWRISHTMNTLFASVLLWARNEFYDYEEEMYQEREATAQDIDAGAFLTRLAEEIAKE